MQNLVKELSLHPRGRQKQFLEKGLASAIVEANDYERTRVSGSGIDKSAMQQWVEDKLKTNGNLRTAYNHITTISQ